MESAQPRNPRQQFISTGPFPVLIAAEFPDVAILVWFLRDSITANTPMELRATSTRKDLFGNHIPPVPVPETTYA